MAISKRFRDSFSACTPSPHSTPHHNHTYRQGSQPWSFRQPHRRHLYPRPHRPGNPAGSKDDGTRQQQQQQQRRREWSHRPPQEQSRRHPHPLPPLLPRHVSPKECAAAQPAITPRPTQLPHGAAKRPQKQSYFQPRPRSFPRRHDQPELGALKQQPWKWSLSQSRTLIKSPLPEQPQHVQHSKKHSYPLPCPSSP